MKTLVEKPSLAQCVRTLHVTNWKVFDPFTFASCEESVGVWKNPPPEYQEHCRRNPLGSDVFDCRAYDLTLLHERVNLVAQSEDEAGFWMTEIKRPNPDAWIGLLLTILPNLSRLEIQLPKRTQWARWVMRWAATENFGPLPFFRSLSEVFVDTEGELGGITCKKVIPFFQLPSMSRFYANKLLQTTFASKEWDLTPTADPAEIAGSSPITHIEINEGHGRWGMWELIESCKNLQSFKYNHSSIHYRDSNEFKPRAFYNTLLPFDTPLRQSGSTMRIARSGIKVATYSNPKSRSHPLGNSQP